MYNKNARLINQAFLLSIKNLTKEESKALL